MADANQGYTLREAVQFCRLVDGLDMRWFEEPCRWTNDRRAMRDVRYLSRRSGGGRPERGIARRCCAI